MKSLKRNMGLLTLAAAMGAGVAGNAQAALDLSGVGYVTYGDANSYALQVEGVIAGDTGPGSAYYVNSTPGAIKDLIVVATGAAGAPVTTNVADMDNALSTPNGVSGSNFFSGVWNSTLAAFAGFLGSENPLFYFNNNQVNSGASTNQNLAVWAQISLTGASVSPVYFDFTNNGGAYAIVPNGGGVFLGDVTAYTSSGAGPLAGTNAATDYVLSGGAICLNIFNAPVTCGSAADVTGSINNNLGANQAAYALSAPELNDWLLSWSTGGKVGYTDLHIDLRFGCALSPTVPVGTGDCIGRDANNGYEQLFIGTSTRVTQVPEPGILALLALGMLGLAATTRRRKF